LDYRDPRLDYRKPAERPPDPRQNLLPIISTAEVESSLWISLSAKLAVSVSDQPPEGG
jgi:hypothetical protein